MRKKNRDRKQADTYRILCADADSELTVLGSTFKYRCAVCQTPVMLSPSGQAFLKKNPTAELVCFCQLEQLKKGKVKLHLPDLEALKAELKSIVPNTHRNRN